jgi:hypothetical protein
MSCGYASAKKRLISDRRVSSDVSVSGIGVAPILRT